jgi:hypothetical protein
MNQRTNTIGKCSRMKFSRVATEGSPVNRSASTGTVFAGRQEGIHVHFEGFSQHNQFRVRDATELGLDLRECPPAQVPTKNRTPGGEHFLRYSLLVAQFSDSRAHNVLRFSGHAPKMELDRKLGLGSDCSNFGAKFSWKQCGGEPPVNRAILKTVFTVTQTSPGRH